MKLLIAKFTAWRHERANRCRIDEEWCGYFIGRCYCATHGYRWDPPIERPCPGHRRPVETPDSRQEGMWIS